MPKTKQIKFTQISVRNERMLNIGESRGLPRRNATVAKAFIDLILKVDAMEEVQQTLQKQGGDVFSFIEQAVSEKISAKNNN